MSCPACFTGSTHDHGTAKGRMEPLYGLSTYVATPLNNPTPKSTILYLPDVFGLKLINNKLLADRYAADTGCRVLIPDILPGGGASPAYIDRIGLVMEPVAWTDIFGQFNRLWATAQVLPPMVAFMMKGAPAKMYPRVLEYARAVKADIPVGGKFGVAGFCWGGYGSSLLCIETSEAGGTEKLIDAQFCAHPTKIDFEKIIVEASEKFKVPYSMAIGNKDASVKKAFVEALQKDLKEKLGEPREHAYEIKLYEGCRHGFAVRANPELKVEITAAEEATKQAVDWFNKYL